jgi:hypothetical protein
MVFSLKKLTPTEEETIEEITRMENEAMDNETDEEVDIEEKKLESEEVKFQWSVPDKQKEDKRLIKRLPIFLKYVLYIIAGWAVLAIPGLISFFLFSEPAPGGISATSIFTSENNSASGRVATGFKIESLPAFFYCLFLAISWFYLWIILYASRIVPETLIRITNLVTRLFSVPEAGIMITHYLDYMKALSRYLSITFYALANTIVWALMFPRSGTKPSNEVISQIFSFFLIASIIWTIEKLLLHLFSAQFHQRAYAERLDKIQYSADVLERLSRGVRVLKQQGGFTFFGSSKNSSENDLNQGRKGSNFNIEKAAQKAAHIAASKVKDVGSGLASVGKALAGLDLANRSSIKSFGDPYKLAKRLFLGIRRDGSQSLFLQDFEPFFESLDESVEAFKVFDSDGNGDVTRAEFRAGIVEIYQDADSLEASILQSTHAMQKIDSIMKVYPLFI